jgi:hypothetical protein
MYEESVTGQDGEGYNGHSKPAIGHPNLDHIKPPSPDLFDRECAIEESEDRIQRPPEQLWHPTRKLQVYKAKDNGLQEWNVQKPREPRRAPVDQLILTTDQPISIPEDPSSRKYIHSFHISAV